MQSIKFESIILCWRLCHILVIVQSILYAMEALLMPGSLVCDILHQYTEQSLKTGYIEDSEY